MINATIAVIGGGNMGASLLGGLIANQYPRDKLWVTDADAEKLQTLKNNFQINTTNSNAEAIKNADVVILAVKPQILAHVTHEIASQIQKTKPLVISIAAGVNASSIQKWLGNDIAIVRCMPNTPALISCGATALFANAFVTQEQHELAESILRAVGIIVWVDDEKQMDTVTALSGSGPAYFFLMMEAMQDAAQELGLSAETTRLLAQQTALGAARMALESDVDVVELRKRVTSPGGTTEQALRVLEEHKIRDIFKKALTAAKNRSEELAKMIDTKGES